MTERQEMEAVVEAILFVSNDPVSRAKLLEVFAESERELAGEALDAVIERYREDPRRGVLIDEVAGGLRLVSRPDLHGYLRRFFEVTGTNKLSMPALESLAIIAYRQPVTAPEIQELRGVNSSGVLKKLLERRLIRIAGRKEVVGKPFLYGTTREFLQHFGLRTLKELPPLEQFEELFGSDVEGAPESLPPDAEEEIEKEVVAVEEQLDEAMERAEIAAIEDERAAAEAAVAAADEGTMAGGEQAAGEDADEGDISRTSSPEATADEPPVTEAASEATLQEELVAEETDTRTAGSEASAAAAGKPTGVEMAEALVEVES